MSDQTNPADAPTIEPKTQTVKNSAPRKLKKTPNAQQVDKTDTPTIEQETPTDKQDENHVQKRGDLKQSELIKWTVFARPEVKVAVQKAAKKRGITDTAWLDEKLWSAATDDLTKKAQPPAKQEDMADILKQFTDKLEASQVATTKAQNDLIQQQGQQIAALTEAISKQPTTFKEMLFGKAK